MDKKNSLKSIAFIASGILCLIITFLFKEYFVENMSLFSTIISIMGISVFLGLYILIDFFNKKKNS